MNMTKLNFTSNSKSSRTELTRSQNWSFSGLKKATDSQECTELSPKSTWSDTASNTHLVPELKIMECTLNTEHDFWTCWKTPMSSLRSSIFERIMLNSTFYFFHLILLTIIYFFNAFFLFGIFDFNSLRLFYSLKINAIKIIFHGFCSMSVNFYYRTEFI